MSVHSAGPTGPVTESKRKIKYHTDLGRVVTPNLAVDGPTLGPVVLFFTRQTAKDQNETGHDRMIVPIGWRIEKRVWWLSG